jgi:uncharacterized DUF497 family protein
MAKDDHTYPEAFEWDETKRLTNLAKHGIDFAQAARVFDGRVVEWEDRSRDYGERRWRVVGRVDHAMLFVVYTRRSGKRRLISARRASQDERQAYHTGITSRPR